MEAQPQRLREMTRVEMPKAGIYRHFKGAYYRLLGVAQHSETREPMAVYQALYGERGLWVRPLAMWGETVQRDGYCGPRFCYVCEQEAQLDAPAPPTAE